MPKKPKMWVEVEGEHPPWRWLSRWTGNAFSKTWTHDRDGARKQKLTTKWVGGCDRCTLMLASEITVSSELERGHQQGIRRTGLELGDC